MEERLYAPCENSEAPEGMSLPLSTCENRLSRAVIATALRAWPDADWLKRMSRDTLPQRAGEFRTKSLWFGACGTVECAPEMKNRDDRFTKDNEVLTNSGIK